MPDPLVPPHEPNPVCPDTFNKFFLGADVCSVLRQAMLTNSNLQTFFNWMFESTPPGSGKPPCFLSTDFAFQLISLANPIGSCMWSPVELVLDTDEWLICDGKSYSKLGKYRALATVLGGAFDLIDDDEDEFRVPNLEGRVMLGAGKRSLTKTEEDLEVEDQPSRASREASQIGGGEEVILTAENLAEHKHGFATVQAYSNPKSAVGGQTAGDAINFPLDIVDEDLVPEDDRDGNGGPPRSYAVKAHTQRTSISIGDATRFDKDDDFVKGVVNVHLLTTEPVKDLRKDPDDDPLPPAGDPINTLPPYMTGIHYIRANYKFNGVLMYPDVPETPVTP